ncbi:MAG TPA: HindIII family type II restriction endonuclease [Methylotenera sp.]
MTIINKAAVDNRFFWVEEIRKLSGDFSLDSNRMESELTNEIKNKGILALLDHLRLCGDIPESYSHDSSEEKLYSKYTDSLLCESFKMLGLKSLVIKERGDAADVDAYAKNFNFVADAKSFRLSRTAKNQKDFKVQAMDGWRRDKNYAMVVCPIYQLPASQSQIYQQASSRNVCIFTYSHLAMLLTYSEIDGKSKSEELLHQIFKTVNSLNPSKDASLYWLALNRTMLGFSSVISDLWKKEKEAAVESIAAAKEIALTFLAAERTKIMKMSHDEALLELIKVHKIDSKIKKIKSVSNNSLLEMR